VDKNLKGEMGWYFGYASAMVCRKDAKNRIPVNPQKSLCVLCTFAVKTAYSEALCFLDGQQA
jgi:hypothetical protein